MKQSPWTIPVIFALVFAFWGALLSTFLAIRQFVRERRQDRPQIHVNGLRDYIYTEREDGQLWTEPETDGCLLIRVVSDGPRPVQIEELGVASESGRPLISTPDPMHSDELPRRIQDGESVTVRYRDEDLKGLVKILEETLGVLLTQVYAADSVGRTYLAKMDLSPWR